MARLIHTSLPLLVASSTAHAGAVDGRLGLGFAGWETARQGELGVISAAWAFTDSFQLRGSVGFMSMANSDSGAGLDLAGLVTSRPLRQNHGAELRAYGGGSAQLGGESGTGRSLLALAPVAGLSAHLGAAPLVWSLEVRPQLVVLPDLAADVAFGVNLHWWL